MSDYCLTPNWPAPPNVQALTTLKTTPPDLISQLPAQPKWLDQVHGANVVCADDLIEDLPKADAVIAFKTATVCAIRTGDCLPVLVCDTAGTQVAAIHAGWRSLSAGIITATLQRLSAPSKQCLVWLGPAIGPSAFEVGSDVLDSFAHNGWQQQDIQNGFRPKPESPKSESPKSESKDKWLGNLYYLARSALQQHGILAENIYGGEWCTYSDPARFYSYRRSADTGRMVSLIYLK